jgi:hypothetical protein
LIDPLVGESLTLFPMLCAQGIKGPTSRLLATRVDLVCHAHACPSGALAAQALVSALSLLS